MEAGLSAGRIARQLVHSDCVMRKLKHRSTVWGVIAYNTRSTLVLIRGTMTAQRYVHDILKPHVLLLLQRLPGAIFQQDNVRPHTARVPQDCHSTLTILPWPTRSPD
ncbi:transposable element Tcb2 transposase [Trichonephila clavipes]|nr:transposable element Tcb2 transposase [Trichonephila clavipes]